jgi:hypothetical protein
MEFVGRHYNLTKQVCSYIVQYTKELVTMPKRTLFPPRDESDKDYEHWFTGEMRNKLKELGLSIAGNLTKIIVYLTANQAKKLI